MSKFLKYTTLIAIIFFVLVFFLYCVRVSIFVPAIQKYVSKKTGCEIKFDNFYILPFSLTFVGVSVDNSVSADKVTFKLNPATFFTNINSHVNFVNQINISRLKISLNLNKINKNILFSKKISALKLHKFVGVICIDETVINRKVEFLKIINSNISVNSQKIIFGSTLCVSNIPIKLDFYFERKTNNIFTFSSVFTSKNKINLLLKSIGTINLSSLCAFQNIRIEKLSYKGFRLDGASGIFSIDRSSCNMNLSGEFGEFKLKSSAGGTVEVNSKIDISKINKKMKGSVKLNFKCEDKKILKLNVANLVIFGVNFENFILLGLRDKSNAYNISCVYESGKKVKAKFLKTGNYEVGFFAKNKILGMIKGNIESGRIIADVKKVNFKNLPIVSFSKRRIEGEINISGEIDDSSGQIDFTFKKLKKSNSIENTSINGTVNRNRNKYVFSFYKANNSIIFNSVIENGKIVLVDFKFSSLSISDVLNAFGYFKHNVFGTASGYVKYERNVSTIFYIKGFNGTFYNNNFKNFEVKGDINSNRVYLNRFIIRNESNRTLAYATGLISFTNTSPISFFSINFKNVNVGSVMLNGHTEFRGCLKNYNKIKGVIKNPCGIVVSGIHFRNILAEVIISKKDISLSNLKSDNGLRGDLSINFVTSNVAGNIYFKHTNIKNIYHGVSGFLNSTIDFSGELTNPNIKIKVFLRKGRYFLLHFTLELESEYKNRVFKINKIVMLTDSAKIIFNVRYLKSNTFYITIENLTEKVINALVGFRVPIRGTFSGNVTLNLSKIRGWKQHFKMFFRAKNAYIGNVKLNDIESKIEIINGNILISDTSAAFLNGEIKAVKGFLNVKSGEYGLNLFLLNVQIGPLDLFGGVKLSGKIIKRKHVSVMHSGTINFYNLWLNSYKLPCSQFNYVIRDNKIELLQKVDVKNLYSSSGIVTLGTPIFIKKISIVKDKSSLNLQGDFSKNSTNLRIKISNIFLDLVGNILNLPNVFEGYANININLFGDINKPKGSISIASKSGSILKVPYDNLEIKISFSDNFAQIKKATFFKRNEFSVSVIGSLPFWLGKTITIKSQHEPINIFYEIEDYGLNILKYLTQGYIKPYFGKMSLMGSCIGTYGRIKNNGKILITKGSFDLKDYIGRVKDMFIDLSIAENLVEINKFNFKSGSGKLNVFGSLSLDNFNIKNFNLRFLTDRKGIFIRISQLPKPSILRYKSLRLLKNYSSGKPYFDIRLQGTPDNPKISGYVLLENTRFTFPWNISKTNPFFFIPKNTEFDLEIKTAKNTRFENSFVSALIKGSVHLGGYCNNLKASGTLVASKGRVDYLGYEFYITSALIEIIDVGQIYISAKGETTIPLTNAYGFENLRFIIERSKISDLSMLKFPSNKNLMDFPAFSKKNLFENATKVELNKKELIDLKFKGMPSFIICQQTSYFINRIFIAIAKTILTKAGMLDDLRVSHINTNVDVSNRGGYKLGNWLSGTKYSFEKNLTNQLLFGYSVILDKSRKHNDKFDLKLYHAVELEYKLTDNLFLSASYEFMSDNPDYKLGRKIMFKNQIRF